MKTLNNYPSIKKEMASHVIDKINDGVLTNDNRDEWHHHAFNIIGYWECNQWLKKHDMDAFEAIGICQEFEKEHFGEQTKNYDNSETTVNMLAYVLGYELIYSDDFEKLKDLKKAMKEIAND